MHATPPRAAFVVPPALALTVLLSACGGGVMDLEVGDCLDQSDLQGEQVSDVTPVDCSEPHDAEVYSRMVHPDGPYPPMRELRTRTEEQCAAAFEDFIGLPYEESELYYTYLAPTEESWTTAEDRTSLCLVLSDEPVTGSLEGAAR